MIKKWEILESKELFSSPFIVLREEKLERSEGKSISNYYAIERPDVVYVAALTKTGDLVLVNQYKNGIKKVILELPTGFINKGEKPEKAARRELLEETGYTAKDFIRLGGFNSGSGLSRNINYFFLAKNAEKTAEQNLDDNEEIEVKTESYLSVLTKTKNGESVLPEVQSQLGVLLTEKYL